MTTAPRAKIGMWTSPEKKERFAALAAARGMSETALLVLLVDHVLETNPAPPAPVTVVEDDGASTDRLTLRLRPGDRPLVEARAAKRGMKASSYLVMLVRAHVRGRAPLPLVELNELKAAVGELSAIGRNLNQLVRSAHVGHIADATLQKVLDQVQSQVAEMRQYVASLVRVNLESWEAGDA